MARYLSRTITGTILPKPPIGPVTGLQLMKGARAIAVQDAQDRVVALSKRIIVTQSLQGDSWLVPNTNPDDPAPATRTYPDATTWRTTMRVNAEITPGCFLRLGVVAIPSGQTQKSDGAAGFDPSGAFGRVRANLTWTDADAGTDTTTTEVSITASNQTYAAARTGNGDAWVDLVFQRSEIIYPDDTLTDVTVLRQWSRPPVTVTGTIDHLGGARVVSVCLYEVPLAAALEVDDDADEWVQHFWSSTGGLLVTPYPWQHKVDPVDGDPRGVHRMLEVHEAQRDRLGPTLFSWSAWKEDDADPAAIAEGYASTTATTWKHLGDSNITAWSTDAPGWSLSAGAYARNQSDNGQWVFNDGPALNETTASIPILVRVYGYVESGSSGGTLRLQVGAHSYMDCTITGTSGAWNDFYGHLECGLGPEQPMVAVPIFKSATNAKYFRITAIVAYVCRTAPAA